MRYSANMRRNPQLRFECGTREDFRTREDFLSQDKRRLHKKCEGMKSVFENS